MQNSWICRTVLAGVAAAAAAVIAAAAAAAHVTVSGPDATRGGSGVLTFRVPNESTTGSATTGLSVRLPPLTHAETEPTPGWKSTVTRDDKHRVTSVTWTASEGSGIGPGHFEQFAILADGLPDTDVLALPAAQTYADGTVVTWDQQPGDGEEPEFPAPALALAPAQDSTGNHGDIHASQPVEEHEEDTTARWLASIAIVLASLGVLAAAGVLTRLRARPPEQ